MKQKSSHTLVKSRTYLAFIVTMLFIASSSVYAANSQNITSSEQNPDLPSQVQQTQTEQIIPANNESIETVTIEEQAVPAVQYLTGIHQSAETLSRIDDANSFFENSVFVGDSITVAFETYCRSHDNTILTDSTHFLARVSGSVNACISPNALTTYANVMPLYHDIPQYVEDSISQIGNVEKVFICFGVNDLVACSPEKYITHMNILVDRILEKNPGISIYIISIPCIVETVSTGYLTNSTIMAANQLLQENCSARQWGFINLTEYLMNENLAIRAEYSADGFVHENAAAYDVWIKVLQNYAYEGMTE